MLLLATSSIHFSTVLSNKDPLTIDPTVVDSFYTRNTLHHLPKRLELVLSSFFVTLFNNSIYLTKTETFLVTYSIFLSYYYYFFFWSFWRSETSLSLSFFSLQGNLSYKDCVRRWKVRARVLTGHHQATFVCWQNLYTYIFLFDIFPTSVSFIETAISLLSLKRVTLRVGNSGDNIATRSRLKKNRNEKKTSAPDLAFSSHST